MSFKTLNILFHIFLPLLVGSAIYLLFRSKGIVSAGILAWKPHPVFIYTLPDFLWLYALLHSMHFIWQVDKRVWFWLILCTLLSIGSEVLQLFNYIPGTFDYYDIAAYLTAFLIVSIHILILQFKLRQYENIH